MKTKQTGKILSLMLAVCMVSTMIPMAAFAEAGEMNSGAIYGVSPTIAAFEPLDGNIALQTVKTGTSEDELNLPGTLEVTVTESVYGIETEIDLSGETLTTVAVADWTAEQLMPSMVSALSGSGAQKRSYRLYNDSVNAGMYGYMREALPGEFMESHTNLTLPLAIKAIRDDALDLAGNGKDININFAGQFIGGGVLDIGTGQARFENSATETWGHITFTGVIRSNTTGWATVFLNGVSAEIQAEILNVSGDALSIGGSPTVEISSGQIITNADHVAYRAVNNFGNGILKITGGKIWATFGGTPVHNDASGSVEISGAVEIKAKDSTQSAVVIKTSGAQLKLGGSPVIRGTINAWVGKLEVPHGDGFNPGNKRYTLTLKGTPGVQVGDVAVDNGKRFIRNFKLTNENLYLTTTSSSIDLLVTDIEPSLDYVVTGSNGTFSALYGGTEEVPNASGTLDAVIQGIGVDAMGDPCGVWFGNSSTTLDIGSGTATFENGPGFTWGGLTLYGKITSASNSATVCVKGITITTNADITNSGSGDGITLKPNGGTLNITGGSVTAASGSAVSNLLPMGGGISSVLNISSPAVLSSANYQEGINELEGGTLNIKLGSSVNINGGTIRNTGGGNAIFSKGSISLTGSPDINGPIRVDTPSRKISVDNSFVPGSKSYSLTVYELSGSILGEVVVAGGAAFINSFLITNKGYDLITSGDDLVAATASQKISLVPVANKDFGSAMVGYAAPSAYSVTVCNGGNQETGDLSIALSGADADSFALSKTEIDSMGVDGTDSFTVAPKEGLSAKAYNAIVTVSGGAGIAARSFAVKFKVLAPTITFNANSGIVTPATMQTDAAGKLISLPTPTRSGSYSFDGWFTAANGGSKITTNTVFSADTTIYAHWTYTGGSGGSGGGSGSGGSGGSSSSSGGSGGSSSGSNIPSSPSGSGTSNSGTSVTINPPSSNNPNAPTQGEIRVHGITDNNGGVTADVTSQTITDAFDKVLEQAKRNGSEKNGISLILNVSTGSQHTNNLTVNLPKEVLDTIIDKGITNIVIAVNGFDIVISMDLAAVREMNRQARGNVSLAATRIDNGTLSSNSRAAIGSRPVFDLKVNHSNSRRVQSFGSGSISVTIPYTLGTNELAGNVQAVYVDESGNVHWLANSVYDSVNKVLRFSTNHFSTYGVGYKQDVPNFTDISAHWAKEDIAFVANRGLLGGTSADSFSPNTAMTRGMFVTALGRLANADVSAYKQSSFNDVKSDAYYMAYVEWASKNSIVNGTGNGEFAPDQSITREQMAVMMQSYAKAISFTLPKVHGENTFGDNSKISAYAKDAVKQIQMAGVISGKNGNTFDPQGTATRAEVSAVLRRFVELTVSSDTAQAGQ